MATGKSGTLRVYQAIDSLLANHKAQPVLEITESMLRNDPRDWEALYRAGVALASLEKPADATKQFEDLLALRIDDDDKSASAKARARKPSLQPAGGQPYRPRRGRKLHSSSRIGMTYLIRRVSTSTRRQTLSLVSGRFWSGTHGRLGLALGLRGSKAR